MAIAGWNAQFRSPFLTVSLVKFTFPPLGLRQLLLHSKKKAGPASGRRVFCHIRIPLLSRAHLSRQPEAGKGTPPSFRPLEVANSGHTLCYQLLVVESIHLFAPFFLDAKFFAASNALNAVPVLPT